ncbi:hypothetical protein GZH53_16785 [Flavihumibacter sp. R14]|nr:hypothetical protein [Flavihumibacter soli]
MDIFQFLLLTTRQRAEVVSRKEHLFKRVEFTKTILLYQINNFFVEVHLEPNTKKIERLIAFKSTELLEPYLSNVCFADIGHLLN